MSTQTHRDGIYPFPSSMKEQFIDANGTSILVRSGSAGPAVVLLHGFGNTGDMWGELAQALIADHTVIVPDLPGIGRSAKPKDGYDKKTQALNIAGVLDALGIDAFDFVTHDLGVMVAYPFIAEFPQRVGRWVAMEAPLPGIGPWEHICAMPAMPAMWQFGFGGPDMERLVAGRERIYLDRFWSEFSQHPERWDEAKREHYAALYAQPGAIHAGFAQFHAFVQDASDNQAFLARGKLKMPILAVGGESASGKSVAMVLRFAADDVTEACPNARIHLLENRRRGVVITVADTGKEISRETQVSIYKAFYTTKGVPGTGHGLWISSEIVRRHHGLLRVRSKEGSGTVFQLFLPFQAATGDERT